MLVQWRYKIRGKFGVLDGTLIEGKMLEDIIHSKPRPNRFFIYRASKRKYDYVDYTGVFKGKEVEPSFTTLMLEFLGYISYIDNQECNGRVFK